MAGEHGTTVEFDTQTGDTGPTQEESVARYDQEQGVTTEETTESQSTETTDTSVSGETSTEDNSQETSEDNSESEESSETETEDNSEEESEDKSTDFSEFFEEFSNKGELSEDSYAKLEEQGIPRSTVDDYIQSRTQLGEAITTTAHEVVGGSEQYNAMAEWMRNNLEQSELQEYNKAVDSGNFHRALEAVRGMKGRFEEAVGSESAMVTDNADSGSTSVAGYNSQREMQQDMADPRYSNDPHFREQVRRKLANAKF